jgi:branched-chain amino acid transport system permease protein
MKRHPNLLAALALLAAAALAQGLYALLPPYPATILMLCLINASLATSLNLVNGLAGQFSLGHAGFMAIGAYVAASCTTPSVDLLGLANQALAGGVLAQQALLVLALLLAGLAAGLAGYLVGLPSLRLRGDYLAIVTLGFGEIIRVLILNIPMVGGPRGLSGVPPYASAFGAALLLGLLALGIHRLVGMSHGRVLLAVRADEVAAAALGSNPTRFKVAAFTASAAAGGVAGGMLAHVMMYLNPSSFTFMRSVEVVVMVVLGGAGSISGGILAAVLLTILPEALRPLQQLTGVDLRMVLYSLLLIMLMRRRP